MSEIRTWTDENGRLRCDRTIRTDAPRAATLLTIGGVVAPLAGRDSAGVITTREHGFSTLEIMKGEETK